MNAYTHYCLNTGEQIAYKRNEGCNGCDLIDFATRCVIPSMLVTNEETARFKAVPRRDYEVSGRFVPGAWMVMALWLHGDVVSTWVATMEDGVDANALWTHEMRWAKIARPSIRSMLVGATRRPPSRAPEAPWGASSFHAAIALDGIWQDAGLIRAIQGRYIQALMIGAGK